MKIKDRDVVINAKIGKRKDEEIAQYMIKITKMIAAHFADGNLQYKSNRPSSCAVQIGAWRVEKNA